MFRASWRRQPRAMMLLPLRLRGILESLHQAAFRLAMRLIVAERVPDFITRAGIRYLLSIRLKDVRARASVLVPAP